MGTILSFAATGWPFAIPNLLYLLKCYRPDILKWLRKQIPYMPYISRPRYTYYRDVREETQYWQTAKRFGRILDKSNARSASAQVPIVRYYEPKLLPMYRRPVVRDPEAEEFQLSSKVFCKWHRMVFPDEVSQRLCEQNDRLTRRR